MQSHHALAPSINGAPCVDPSESDRLEQETSVSVSPEAPVHQSTTTSTALNDAPPSMAEGSTPDHFVVKDGQVFAGTHLIIDLWGARHLDDLERMDAALRQAVEVSGATLLHIHLHHFSPEGGISGVAVLAESHISVHTWPERNFAAFDVFMCGDAVPSKALHVLEDTFYPSRMNVSRHLRGIVREDEV